MNQLRVFIPNRGELVKRISRTCKKMGFGVFGMVPDGDRELDYTDELDDFASFDETRENEFLNVSKIIQYAKQFRCRFLHPGWGFLSENPELAKACEEAEITFVGPSWKHLEVFGDKDTCKKAISRYVNLPPTPSDNQNLYEWVQQNLPVVVKAKFGGGGRGMRKVESVEHFDEIIDQCRRESKYFGKDEVLVEKCIERARHIEFQVVRLDQTVILGTRDCTIQRRHQKLIEEAPANIPRDLQARTERDLSEFFNQVDYKGVATVEFLFDGDQLYFLEINPRLQVEHTVTEEIFGVDLVEAQMKIALGEGINLPAEPTGHSIQVRLNAESGLDFEPDFGRFEQIFFPCCRVERTYSTGNQVNQSFDNLIAKLIFTGQTRDDAIKQSIFGLMQTYIKGVRTNQAVLLICLTARDFRAGTHFTTWLEDRKDVLISRVDRLERFLATREISGDPFYGFRLFPDGDKLEVDLPN